MKSSDKRREVGHDGFEVSGGNRGRRLWSLASRLARVAGRRGGLGRHDGEMIEMLEQRVLLDGLDHPSFPNPFNPNIGTVITLQNAPGTKDDGRGAVEGNIASASGDDTFIFTMPGVAGSKDFVSVLVDTIVRGDNTTPWNSNFDSYVEVYNSSGQLISSGSNNGVLSSTSPNVATDGWTGFVGTAGEKYTIRVRSEQGAVAAGRERFGNYTLRVDAATEAISINTTYDADPESGQDFFGDGLGQGQISYRQDEGIFKIVVPNDSRFRSLATAHAVAADITLLDTHLSIYDAQGSLVADDRQAGRLTNASVVFSSDANLVFYARVRSDELGVNRPSTGQFYLVTDMAALDLPLDPVTRVNETRNDETSSPSQGTGGTTSKLYQFTARGNGLAFITLRQSGRPPLPDPALHVYNSNGQLISFNDDFAGTSDSQVEVVLQGGVTYFVLVESFDLNGNGKFILDIEAHHTYGPTLPVDDHVDADARDDQGFGILNNFRTAELATPIVFGAPYRSEDSFKNIVDRSWIQTGVSRGRIYSSGDTDVFQFTAPLSQQGIYTGDDGNQGRALYVGGNFASSSWNGSASGKHGIDTPNVSIYDAGRFYQAGYALEENGALDGDIYAMAEWDPDGAGPTSPWLIAGGKFNMLDAEGVSVPVNLAVRVAVNYDPMDGTTPRYEWYPLGAEGTVYALAVGDLLDNGGGITAPELIIGGSFTSIAGATVNNLGALLLAPGGLSLSNLGGGVGGGASPAVRALTFHDPAVAPTPPGGQAPFDRPTGLYVGGKFTSAGGQPVNNIARFGINAEGATLPTWEPLGSGVAGIDEILTLESYDPPDPDGGAIPARLYAGGRQGGTNGFLRYFDPSAATAWSNPLPYGGTGPVRDLAVWVLPENVNPNNWPYLVAGGGTDSSGFVQWTLGGNFAPVDNSEINGSVNALTVFTDSEPAFVTDTQVLYIGGSFTKIVLGDGETEVKADRLAKYDLGVQEPAWTALGGNGGGVSELSPGATGVSAVYALATFDDNLGTNTPAGSNNPLIWDRLERGASRVFLRANPNPESFLTTQVSVYDSNLNLVYTNYTLSTIIDTPNAGSYDPSAPDPDFVNVSPALGFVPLFTFNVWGGEVYYIVVSGGGTGGYTLELTTDAVPPEQDDNGDGWYQDEISSYTETPDGTLPSVNGTPVLLNEQRARNAPELSVSSDGRTRTYKDPTNELMPNSFNMRSYDITPAGIRRQVFQDLPTIDRVGDTDVYKFRATATGYAEIRIATLNIINGYQEVVAVPGQLPIRNILTKTYNSPLDSALRVYNNDFEQVAYNNDTFAVDGRLDVYQVDDRDDSPVDPSYRVFSHRDARVVIPVQVGQTYFVQVESGQLLTSINPDSAISSMVDWRHATGAYEVLIGMTPDLNGIDDHSNDVFNPTPVRVVDSTGDGSVTGVIDDIVTGVFQNPNDTDVFHYFAPNRGQTTFKVVPTDANSLLRSSLSVINSRTGAVEGQITAGPGATATLNLFPKQGDDYIIIVDGDSGSEGSYRLEINGPGASDDHASEDNFAYATGLSLVPFFGTATATGVIENPGDRDVFKFTAEKYETATVIVDSTSGTLNPYVDVYEIGSDLADSTKGKPIPLRISYNDNGPGLGVDSLATFSTTPGRTYYFVVRGVNESMDQGNYQIQVRVAPTDDHPNFTDFPLATTLALSFDPLTQIAINTPPAQGRIENVTDNDMFRFTAPSNGTARVRIETPESNFAPAVRIYDQSGTELVTLTDGTNGSVEVTISSVVANQQYYIQVLPGTTTPLTEPDTIGTYTVSVTTNPVDDHPDDGQFGAIQSPRDVITLSNLNGVGANTGAIVPNNGAEDTDLFRFVTLAGGSTTVRVTTTGSSFNPFLKIYNSSFVLISGATSNGDVAQQTITAGGAGETYYVVVVKNAGATGASAVGQYQVSVTGQLPGGGGGDPQEDDHVNAGEWGAATIINPDSATGIGNAAGVINYISDTDLFKFTAVKSGTSQVQITVPQGGLVDGQVKIFNQSFVQIASNASGIPGTTAAVSFQAQAGETYFVLVEPTGNAKGTYAVHVATQPLEFVQYYPEGYAGKNINEFVPLVNPNSFPVTFSLYARYETGANPDVPIWTGTVPANTRSGVTITRRNFLGTLVRKRTPFSLELRSSAQLGATFSHYDSAISTGENFTNEPSKVWTFANFNKNTAEFRDFLVFYNPSLSTANLKITIYYENGFSKTFNQTLAGRRRGGVNIENDGRVPLQGKFGVKIESDIAIVAAQSSYNRQLLGGDGLLGDNKGGATYQVIPGVSTGSSVDSRLAIVNTTDQTATVVLVASYARVDLPDLTRVLTIQPRSSLFKTLAEVGLANSVSAGLKISSNVPVTASVMQYQNGDGDATNAGTEAATQALFGDAFINPLRAGTIQIETLSLFNPADTAVTITVTFVFRNGTSSSFDVNVNAGKFAFVSIDQQPAILSLPSAQGFSMNITAPSPFVASFTHYDKALGGGWSTLGSPTGLTNDLSSIVGV